MERSSHHHRQSNIHMIILWIYADQQPIEISYLQEMRHMDLQHNDEVAMLDVSSSLLGELLSNLRYFIGFGDSNEDLSYEDYLSLAESIGQVGSRFSEEEIMGHLKIRAHVSAATASVNQTPDICVICQAEYENDETIGTLKCGHDYHADCIKKWLLENNVCPLCKSTAVS